MTSTASAGWRPTDRQGCRIQTSVPVCRGGPITIILRRPVMLSSTPDHLDIRPRRLNAALPDPLPRWWLGNDPFRTHFFNAMSVLFPDGEQFFIDSVRHFRDRVTDPALAQQIRGFIGQEAHHSREHIEYNQRLRDLGYDIDALERDRKSTRLNSSHVRISYAVFCLKKKKKKKEEVPSNRRTKEAA